MGTDFEEIYELALVDIDDYKLNLLAKVDRIAFLSRLASFLMRGIDEFDGCFKDLTYHTEEFTEDGLTREKYFFDTVLDSKEKSILAHIMTLVWFRTKINDVTAFSPHLSNKNFKQLQESQSLKQKSEYYDKLYERIGKEITEYQFKRINKIGFFGGNKNNNS